MLATTYRPQTFSDMIGQEVLVQTLTNAILQDRIANAFLLTGIRGVGKTTTARIIAKALNCTSKAENSIEPCGACGNCIAISKSSHPDVLEVDAASRTGVDDIRDIIENASYMPGSSKYRIYIIDEVHMLSKSAFNALLKTLEEPPAHVKFIFATTEIRKIPVTILSRCQRFDLKRISLETLAAHLKSICDKENVTIEDDALNLIAKAAEGSVRDSLSLLDQAIVHSSSQVTAQVVSHMMGVSDKHQLMDMFGHIASGKTEQVFARFHDYYMQGMDVTRFFQDILELVHLISKAKVTKQNDAMQTLSFDQWERIKTFSQQLDLGYLTRCWQLLLQGLEEIAKAPVDKVAGEMVLIKLMYMGTLPSPAKVIKDLSEGTIQNTSSSVQQHSPAPTAGAPISSAPTMTMVASSGVASAVAVKPQHVEHTQHQPQDFAQLVELFKTNNEPLLYSWLYNEVQLVKFQIGTLEVHLNDTLPANFTQRIAECLQQWTQMRWMIVVSKQHGEPTLEKQARLKKQERLKYFSNHPEVKKILDTFPGSKVVEVRE